MAKGKPRWNAIKCPCCGEPAKLGPNYPPISQEEKFRLNVTRSVLLEPGWSLRTAKYSKLYWACKKCFRDGRALEAKTWLQTHLDRAPRFAYYDLKKRCKDCKKPFVFSSTEQQKWYEVYKLWVQSEPVHCLACRRLRRKRAAAHKELASSLAELNPQDPLQLAKISDLYLTVGSARKAAEYLARAKNRAGGLEALATMRKI
jgi:hypothetical protein